MVPRDSFAPQDAHETAWHLPRLHRVSVPAQRTRNMPWSPVGYYHPGGAQCAARLGSERGLTVSLRVKDVLYVMRTTRLDTRSCDVTAT